MEKILRIEIIEKYYGNKSNLTKAVDNITFDVDDGEFLAIMCASGSGKGTVLKSISTIDRFTSGHIYLRNEDITKLKGNKLTKFRRDSLGFIFQDFNLLDTLTSFENIAVSLTIQKTNYKLIDQKVIQVAKALGIEEILNKYPYELSGGQKQRVACARAIVTDPDLILAYEPTGALDSKSARMLLDSLNVLNSKLNATIVMVTHDPFTASYAERVICIKDGKIFNEIIRGENSRKVFFNSIMEVQTLLGGELNEVI